MHRFLHWMNPPDDDIMIRMFKGLIIPVIILGVYFFRQVRGLIPKKNSLKAEKSGPPRWKPLP